MIKIYVDGSCSDNGEEKNYGGMGVVITRNSSILKEYSIKDYNTTNNRTELKAVIYAVRIAQILNKKEPKEILIYSDSSYCVQMANGWMFNWAKNNWKKADDEEPLNLDLVKALYELLKFERAIKVKKIKGHSGHEFNDRADELATMATKKAREGDESGG